MDIYSFPSVSKFKQRKNAAAIPTTSQIKKSLQLLADKTAKDPESLKVRNIKPPLFYLLKAFNSDFSTFSYIVQADTDSKNSYGGYEGYKTQIFMIPKPGSPALLIPYNLRMFTEVDLGKVEWLIKMRNEMSDEEFVDRLAKASGGKIYPEKGGRKDTYIYDFGESPLVFWIPKRP
ncbi:MAG: hypothetical protein ACON4R_15925 [Akkermansiaceae bacterium]